MVAVCGKPLYPGPLSSKDDSHTVGTTVASSDPQNQTAKWALPVTEDPLEP